MSFHPQSVRYWRHMDSWRTSSAYWCHCHLCIRQRCCRYCVLGRANVIGIFFNNPCPRMIRLRTRHRWPNVRSSNPLSSCFPSPSNLIKETVPYIKTSHTLAITRPVSLARLCCALCCAGSSPAPKTAHSYPPRHFVQLAVQQLSSANTNSSIPTSAPAPSPVPARLQLRLHLRLHLRLL